LQGQESDEIRPFLNNIRTAESLEKSIAAWNIFENRFPNAKDLIAYLKKQWLTLEKLPKWLLYLRKVGVRGFSKEQEQ